MVFFENRHKYTLNIKEKAFGQIAIKIDKFLNFYVTFLKKNLPNKLKGGHLANFTLPFPQGYP